MKAFRIINGMNNSQRLMSGRAGDLLQASSLQISQLSIVTLPLLALFFTVSHTFVFPPSSWQPRKTTTLLSSLVPQEKASVNKVSNSKTFSIYHSWRWFSDTPSERRFPRTRRSQYVWCPSASHPHLLRWLSVYITENGISSFNKIAQQDVKIHSRFVDDKVIEYWNTSSRLSSINQSC